MSDAAVPVKLVAGDHLAPPRRGRLAIARTTGAVAHRKRLHLGLLLPTELRWVIETEWPVDRARPPRHNAVRHLYVEP
jgi:hypothetical protein